MISMSVIIGWDVGGVHLKAARAVNGRIVDAVQLAAPLRGGLERLQAAFAEAAARMGEADRHVLTMTGELADTFPSRAEGVARLANVAKEQLGAHVQLYAGRSGFIAPADAERHVLDIASANWHASAALIGRRHPNALLIDMGSTTTDIVPVAGGAVAARGYTDAERLSAGELVYTGLVRSFLMASAPRAPFGGTWTPLIAEHFATMADVHRILGTLPNGADLMVTADGRDKTVEASRARLARIVGHDAADADDGAWHALAAWFAENQLRAVTDGAMLIVSAGRLPAEALILGAGIADGVVREVARRLGRPYRPFDSVLDVADGARAAASHCAPAAALAQLAS
jgi:probable H4MPT-linked C1 transfer pathway protein